MQPPRLAEYALAAAEYVRRAVGVELDGTIESLAFVDHYLSTIGGISDEVLRLVAAAIGAYFGEVVISRLGGEWHTEGDDPAEWVIALHAAPLSFRPVAMAAEAIRQDDVPGYEASVTTTPDLEGPLATALEAVGPVEASYFYSLTGRLETLEHSAEVLVELRRQDRDREPRD